MNTKKPQDALELLEADHQAVKQLFDSYRELAAHEADAPQRRALAEQICLALTIHTKLEEELFYPLAREALREDDLLDEAEVEHASARDLIGQILAANPHDQLYDAKVAVLGEYVEHHVQDEQDTLFPKLRGSGLDLSLLGARMLQRRTELQAVPEALREEALVAMLA